MTADALDAGVVWLRPMRASDTSALHSLLSNRLVYEPTSYDVLDLDKTGALIASWLQDAESGRAHRWAVTRRGTDALIGTCGFHRIDPRHHVAELGYEIAPEWWRHGFASAAIGAAVTWAFTKSRVNRIEAVVWVGNTASIRTLEKCSFTREGLLRRYRMCRGEPRDFYMYSSLRAAADCT